MFCDWSRNCHLLFNYIYYHSQTFTDLSLTGVGECNALHCGTHFPVAFNNISFQSHPANSVGQISNQIKSHCQISNHSVNRFKSFTQISNLKSHFFLKSQIFYWQIANQISNVWFSLWTQHSLFTDFLQQQKCNLYTVSDQWSQLISHSELYCM